MKKKLISAAFVVAIVLAAGYNVYNSQNKVALSDLALDNVEALAHGEVGEKRYALKGEYWCCSSDRNEGCRASFDC